MELGRVLLCLQEPAIGASSEPGEPGPCGIYPTSYIRHPTSCILHPTFCILHPTAYILHPTSYILHPAFYIPHLASCILHPTSYTLHPTSCILHRTFCILHPASYILHPTSYILHSTSYILHPTSYVLHPTSYILHPTSYVASIVCLPENEPVDASFCFPENCCRVFGARPCDNAHFCLFGSSQRHASNDRLVIPFGACVSGRCVTPAHQNSAKG